MNDIKILKEQKRQKLRKIVSEAYYEYKQKINEDEGNAQKKSDIKAFLNKDGIKLSEIAYKLWPEMNPDEARSLFSRKLKDTEWHFDNLEINRIYDIMNSL